MAKIKQSTIINKREDMNFNIDNNEVLLKYQENTYQLSFLKSLSNIKSEGDILPLVLSNNNHIKASYEYIDDMITFTYHLAKQSNYLNIKKEPLHLKLQLLRNTYQIFRDPNAGYTYYLSPNNLVYDDNFNPYIIYVGFNNLLAPLSQDDSNLLRSYQCLCISILDNKYDYDALYNGTLEVLKKNAFLNKIYQATSIEEIHSLLDEAYLKENNKYLNNNVLVSKSSNISLKIISILSSITAIITIILISNAYFITIPYKDKMNKAATNFVAKDYGKVIQGLYKNKPKSLPIAQQYMLAYSYIIAEPLNGESKESALNMISVKVDERFLEYWIYLGKEDYEKALDIAKELTDLNLQYHATYRAIDILKKENKLNGEEKEKRINKYNDDLSKLEVSIYGEPDDK